MLVTVTMLAFAWLGYEIAQRRWRGRAGGLEIGAAALCIGSALWIASVWIPALLHGLTRPVMIGRTLLAVILAATAFLSRRPQWPRIARVHLIWIVPISAWVGYVLWRTAFLPPLTHDALAYHLPRAVLWIREHGFAPLNLPIDPRVRLLPANYEMLLADAMLLQRSDALTEWIAVFFYAAFVVACGALAQRWWPGRDWSVAVIMLVSAAVPVVLLHTGADKNDVMVAFFIVSAFLWGGRWLADGEIAALLLCILAIAAAIGTKPQGLVLGVCLAPLLLWRGWCDRRRGVAAITGVLLFSIAALALLGGAFYVSRFLDTPRGEESGFVQYNDWANLWQAPWVLLTAPFATTTAGLDVPWASSSWYWRRDEIYFSHLGIPFAICAVAAPFALWRFRREEPERAPERHAVAAAALAMFVLLLPVRDVPMPHGIYVAALPRYVLFLVPIVFALTIVPSIRGARPEYRVAIVTIALLYFAMEARIAATQDRFVPLGYVRWTRAHPGTRVIPFDRGRAASVLDTAAAQTDKVAFGAGYGAWIHPVFGSSLQRPVTFIDRIESIPQDATWVVVDRNWRVIWQHPNFRDSSQYLEYLGKGTPSAEDRRLVEQLMRDPRFELVYFTGRSNQAIFRRVR